MSNSVRKSLYVFLCSLMGALLFLILHRVVVFGYLILLHYNYDGFNFGFSYLDFLALDYFTLILALLAGGWYGIWVGQYWYEAIYEHAIHKGFVEHLISRYWPNKPGAYGLQKRISVVARKMEDDLEKFEDLAQTAATMPVVPTAKKRVVRRKAKV